MTDIVLVRHGQASFGADDYDCLSARGVQQAAVLGEHWRQVGFAPTRAVSGALKRQRDTARGVLGRDAHSSEAFNEYDASGLMDHAKDKVHFDADGKPDNRAFQHILEASLQAWLQGDLAGFGEDYLDFSARVWRGREALLEGAAPRDQIVVFTSAGVIAELVRDVLGLPPTGLLALNRRIHNASVTELIYGRSGWQLGSFNDTTPLRLAGAELLTYR